MYLEADQWKKLRKQSWIPRATNAKSALRGEKMREAFQKCLRDPDESRKNWKRRAIQNAAALVARLVIGVLRLPKEQQQQVEVAMEMWATTTAHIATDSEFLPELNCCGNILPDEVAQYASELVDGVSEWLMCRQGNSQNHLDTADDALPQGTGLPPAALGGGGASGTGGVPFGAWASPPQGTGLPPAALGGEVASGTGGESLAKWTTSSQLALPEEHNGCIAPCGYFAPPVYWIRTDPDGVGGHYRCPICCTLYQPWIGRSHMVPANKLLTVEAIKGQGDLRTAVGTVKEGTVLYIPFQWANTTEQSLMNRFKEIILEVGNQYANKPVAELVQAVQDMALEKQLQKSFFKPDQLSAYARDQIQAINSTTTKAKWLTEHLEKGFVSGRYRWRGEHVMNQDELARVWGTMRLGVREALKAQRASL